MTNIGRKWNPKTNGLLRGLLLSSPQLPLESCDIYRFLSKLSHSDIPYPYQYSISKTSRETYQLPRHSGIAQLTPQRNQTPSCLLAMQRGVSEQRKRIRRKICRRRKKHLECFPLKYLDIIPVEDILFPCDLQ